MMNIGILIHTRTLFLTRPPLLHKHNSGLVSIPHPKKYYKRKEKYQKPNSKRKSQAPPQKKAIVADTECQGKLYPL